ncbi:hypothetical protein [Enterococcus faecium]|uniref:hypothetical protein n=1 Tax=Enterococcus faecium TaxID=1352 RepID=UPI000BF1D0C7|nr:hypothetical protein [Enterococcus faecium]PEH49543.1 hypothetical protein CRM75_01950 [Enterococcus faecium]
MNNKRFKIKDTTQSIYKSIVNIEVLIDKETFYPHTTGFVIDHDKILTCAHVSDDTKLGSKVISVLNEEQKPFGEFKT